MGQGMPAGDDIREEKDEDDSVETGPQKSINERNRDRQKELEKVEEGIVTTPLKEKRPLLGVPVPAQGVPPSPDRPLPQKPREPGPGARSGGSKGGSKGTDADVGGDGPVPPPFVPSPADDLAHHLWMISRGFTHTICRHGDRVFRHTYEGISNSPLPLGTPLPPGAPFPPKHVRESVPDPA